MEEEFQNMAFVRKGKTNRFLSLTVKLSCSTKILSLFSDYSKDQQAFQRKQNIYEPPPAAQVERMRRNKIMEQKAFALFREIFSE